MGRGELLEEDMAGKVDANDTEDAGIAAAAAAAAEDEDTDLPTGEGT
jgi:hypothetical protein